MEDDVGTMVFERAKDIEVFLLKSASVKGIRHEGFIELFFHVQAHDGPLDSETDKVAPNAEVSVFIADWDESKIIGSRFRVLESYDEDYRDYVSSLHYHERQDLNDNIIDICDQVNGRYRVKWSGTTDAVNHHDGFEPSNRVDIDGMFEFLGIKDSRRSN